MYDNVTIEKRDAIAILTINRPNVLNALSKKTVGEIEAAVGELDADDSVHVIVITGAGGKAFVAGADITEFNTINEVSARDVARDGQRAFLKIENASKPVIAAIEGYALGGGCELAMACDIRIASEKSVFGQPEINLGIIPGYGGTQRLPKLVGPGKAMELILTGENIRADEALRIGLINTIVPAGEALDAALKMAGTIALKGRISATMAKHAVNEGLSHDIRTGCEIEANAFALCFASDDQREGATAFVEKRTPAFNKK